MKAAESASRDVSPDPIDNPELMRLVAMIEFQGGVDLSPDDIEQLGLPNDHVSLSAEDADGNKMLAKTSHSQKTYTCPCCRQRFQAESHVAYGTFEEAQFDHWHAPEPHWRKNIASTWTRFKAISAKETTTEGIQAMRVEPFQVVRRIPRDPNAVYKPANRARRRGAA